MITVLASLTNTLWTIGAALLYSMVLPFIYYADARVNHKFLTRFALLSIFLFVNIFIVIYFGRQWTPEPLYPLAMIQHIVGLILVGSVVAILLERFLKPKLESTQTVRLIPRKN